MAKFPDLTGDGEVTQADVLKGRGVYKKGGSVMKNDHGHKPMAKMSHGGHYCWGGKVMKKAEGGDVKKVMAKDKDRLEGLSEDAKKSMGLPISVYDNGKYDPKASRKIMDENFEEGLRQSREEHGRKMKKEYGSTEDFSYKYPNDDYDSLLPKGRSYKTKATEGMKRGGMFKGGQTEAQRVGRAMSKKYEADDDFEGYKEYKKGRPKITDESGITELLNDRMNATTEDLRTAKSQAGYKKGGMAKGGNWIQSAIKKPGALKKSLGVPMGEKIPAGKLKTASKAPGKMGQRARMAMTLKGMK